MSRVVIKIVSRFDASRVLFEHETTEERQASGLAMRDALEAAVKRRANLSGADLRGAYLRGAYLSGADLSGANLSRANLSGAYLSGADLSRADGEKTLLLGKRPYIGIGPIGSRSDTVSLWLTESGPLVRAGCFWGTLEKFEQAVKATHGENEHGREYAAAIALMRAHVEIWTPAKEIA